MRDREAVIRIAATAASASRPRDDFRQGADPERQGEEQSCGAEGADAAVAHDLEAPVAGGAAEAVGNIGKPILMQGSGRQHHGRDGEHRGKPGAEIEDESHNQRGCRHEPEQQARQGDHAHQARKVRQRMGVLLPRQGWHRKAGIEAHAMG